MRIDESGKNIADGLHQSTAGRIELIQILRLIGAIGITIYHCQVISEHGYCGVELFNVISGFLAVNSTEDENRCRHFLAKRIIRIVPIYWLFTLLFYGIISVMPQASVMSEAKPEYLLKSMFFIPFVNSRGYDTPILGAGWTLNYEMFFYLVFFVALHISHRYRAWISSGIMAGLILIRLAIPEPFVLNYYSDSILLEFVFGMISFYVLKEMTKDKLSMPVKTLLAILAVLSVIVMIVNEDHFMNLPRCVRIGIPAFALFLSVMGICQNSTFPKTFVQLGNATYSIYLIEYFSSAVFKIASAGRNSGTVVVLLVACIGLTLLCGYVCYQLIEVRFTGWMRRKLI